MISAKTDVGLTKRTNQDSMTVKVIHTRQGEMVFAIVCDGMGGLQKGEVASATVIRAFERWVYQELPLLCKDLITDEKIREQWEKIIFEQNEVMKAYGTRCGIRLGTTVVAMLFTQERYYLLNVGDSRAYELTKNVCQLTKDQTFVAREVELGNMTQEQAKQDPRRNVLLQCVGASEEVYPDFFFGKVKENAVYLLCSDGFRHEISAEEIYEKLNPQVLWEDDAMQKNSMELIALNKARQERDNSSVVLIRTL